MKAKHFRKLRKNLKNKEWVERRLYKLAQEDSDNEHFYKFECSSTFRGEKLANLNFKEYLKRNKRIERQYQFLTKISETFK